MWAAGKKASAKPSAARPAKKAVRKSVRPVAPASEFGPAAVVGDGRGLHGEASFYGKGFQGRKTATGDRFDSRQFTAASNHFPLGSWVAVRRVDDDRCAIVKVNDRMHARHRRRVIDVSRAVADYLGMLQAGVVLVRVAPLKSDKAKDGACQSAFVPEMPCVSCDESPLRLPGFVSMPGG